MWKCNTDTYVSLSILRDGLSVLGAVVAVVSVGDDGTEGCEKGNAGEEVHGEDDGLGVREGQGTGTA